MHPESSVAAGRAVATQTIPLGVSKRSFDTSSERISRHNRYHQYELPLHPNTVPKQLLLPAKSSRQPCKFARSCRHMFSTLNDLLAHIHREHLNNLVSTCWLCPFQDSSFLSMLTHLENKHRIKSESLPFHVFLTPVSRLQSPVMFPLNPAFAKVPSYFVVTQYVRPCPGFRPGNVVVPTNAEEEPYDFLEEEESQIEITRNDSRSKGKKRAPVEIDILISSNPWPSHASSTPDPDRVPFSANIAAPLQRTKLSDPFPYRTFGEPLPPKEPPPTLGNYFGMRSVELPRLLDEK